jgi:hypothetical protein
MAIYFNINNVFDAITQSDSLIQDSTNRITYESLVEYFKTNYNQKIFAKKIDDDLVLIYNNFNSAIVTGSHERADLTLINQKLYNECKSLVIKLGLTPRIISYTHDNIENLKISDYTHYDRPTNTFEESYEGTLVSVFSNEGRWYFSTSRCGSIDTSYFHSKTKTFGVLFDECLETMGINREQFKGYLEPNICYYFVLVHHENKYLVDYTEKFGPQYKKLVYAFSRDQATQQLITTDLSTRLSELVVPNQFNTYQLGLDYIKTSDSTEGLIVKILDEQTNKLILLKVHSDKYWILKSHNPNYPNRWYGYLDVFKKDDPNFRIKDYQNEKNIVETLEINGKQIDITGMIYLLYKTSAEILFDIVMHFTKFNYRSNNFEKINNQDYEILKERSYSVLRKQLSILQGLILKYTVRNSADITTHLRKYVSIEDFIGLLSSVNKLIKDDTCRYIRTTNRNFAVFSEIFLSNIKN